METPGAPKRRLGRGLAALIGDDTSEEASVQDVRALRQLPIDLIKANPNNPRKHFPEDDLEDLAKSIREKGLLQPITVRPLPSGEHEIVAGERRWRAAQRAGVHEVPVIIRELSDSEALEIALIENIQRSDLNPLEEARAYSQLLDRFSYTQQQLADAIGKSRSHVANTLRLLNLPEAVRQQIEDGKLSAGHARTLVGIETPAELAEQIIKFGLSVREAESLARGVSSQSKAKAKPEKDADTRALEKLISDKIGLKVEIAHRQDGSGAMTISYKTLEQLDDVCRRLQD
ncbi:MAG: ParB/RepB/Spo0J family partition protein [Aestuariivirga sp.]|jgi:ParB family chromosome partitioning protein|uniref:ParB/RepB/Spo0J family partition protein n=1 Tax=Aestuariivirga sp. TaxID=2650926 RepID=UPI0038D01355